VPGVLSVLIVDDDPSMARLMADLVVAGGGAVCDIAGSGEAALDTLATVSCPDLVLLDINLPGIDGIETAHRMLARWPALRVVLTSTEALADLPADLLDGGVSEFVPKVELGPDRVGALLAG
jgi:CheY-like chemotaxis protein